jgi:hypothetical protein
MHSWNWKPVASKRRYLVIVNPFSGRKLGQKVAETVAIPLLQIAGVQYDHIGTSTSEATLFLAHPIATLTVSNAVINRWMCSNGTSRACF